MDLKTFLKKIVGTVEELTSSKTQPQQTVSHSSGTQQSQQPSRRQQKVYTYTGGRSVEEWMTYFREILASMYSQYSIRENVPVQELTGYVSEVLNLYPSRPYQAYKAEWGLPYSFVLYEGTQVKGIVLLVLAENQYKHVKYLISKMYAQKMGIPFVNFYMDAPNERDYVEYRLESYIHP